jgi:hypothetical protein
MKSSLNQAISARFHGVSGRVFPGQVQNGVRHRCAKHPSGRSGNGPRPRFEPGLFSASKTPVGKRRISSKKVTLGNIFHHGSRTSQEYESSTRFGICAGYFPREVGSEQWCYQADGLQVVKTALPVGPIGSGGG